MSKIQRVPEEETNQISNESGQRSLGLELSIFVIIKKTKEIKERGGGGEVERRRGRGEEGRRVGEEE